MIAEGVGRVRPLINACGKLDADRHGRVIVRATVNSDGRVATLAIEQAPSKLLAACVESRVKLAQFAATTHGGSFRWPFSF
jgi:hypothetical protein